MKELLIKHNPHWNNVSLDPGIERNTLQSITKAIDIPHVIAITGARRSGKSYLFRQICNHLLNHGTDPGNILQINFEDPFFITNGNDLQQLERLYSEYLGLKLPQGRKYLLLDEIQNIDNWQIWIRDIYDRQVDVKLFITGSNSELLSDELASRLTGRVLSFENYPFSIPEYLKGGNQQSLPQITPGVSLDKAFEQLYPFRDILLNAVERSFDNGLFPEVVYLDDDELAKEILSQYFQNVVFRDIVYRFSIRNTRLIEQLAYYLSTNFTSSYSYRKLANSLGTNENTIKEYLSYFEKSYLFFSIDYYAYSLKKQFRRNRKIYTIDSGLRRATSFSFSPDTGKFAENSVFLMLKRMVNSLYYWYADGTNKEVDFIIHDPKESPVAINVCYTDDIPAREFDGLNTFSKLVPNCRNLLITRNRFGREQRRGITIELIPLWLLPFLSKKHLFSIKADG